MLILPLNGGLTPADAEACVAAGDVAAVILRPVGTAPNAAQLRPLTSALQSRDCAVLLEADGGSLAGLDGIHVATPAALGGALKALKPDAIVGAGGIDSRHAAMEAGESGADYVLFGDLGGNPAETARTRDLVAWWSELFEVPCVAVAADLDAVAELAAAGADFIALPLDGAADAAARVRAAQALIEAASAATDEAQ